MSLELSNPLETIKRLANEELAGYSAEEIREIECLYDIIVDGEFRSFMELAGKCSGGVIGDQDMLLYGWTASSLSGHLLCQESYREELREDLGLVDIAQTKPFIFAVGAETQIYLLKTAAADNNIVYHYDQNHDTFEKTEWSFFDYLGGQILSTRELKKHYGDCGAIKGNILRICPPKEKPYRKHGIVGVIEIIHDLLTTEIKFSLLLPQKNSTTSRKSSNLLDTIKNLANEELAGYSDEEIDKIECLYDIIINGELRRFLKLAGKCSGGVIGNQEMIFYRENMNIREHLIFQENIIERIRNINLELLVTLPTKPFIFAVAGESQIYLLKTATEDNLQVYCYDQSCDTFEIMEWNFLDYVEQQIIRERENQKNRGSRNIYKGNLLRIFPD